MSLTREDTKDKDKKNEATWLSFLNFGSYENSASSLSTVCTGDSCSLAPAPLPESSYDQQFAFMAPEANNTSCLNDGFASNADTEVSISYGSIALKGVIGAFALTKATELLAYSAKSINTPSSYLYWLSQIPRAAFMTYMGASLGRILFAPAADYVLTRFCGLSDGWANLLTSAATITFDFATAPWRAFPQIAAGAAVSIGASVAGHLLAKKINFNFFKNCARGLEHQKNVLLNSISPA